MRFTVDAIPFKFRQAFAVPDAPFRVPDERRPPGTSVPAYLPTFRNRAFRSGAMRIHQN